MALLTKEQILNAEDRQYAVVPCPEWGGEVRVRSITGAQRDRYEAGLTSGDGANRKLDLRNARSKLVAMCIVDAEGNLLFTTEDIAALGRKNAAALDRVFDKCRELAGLAEGDVERAVENFEEDPSESGISD